MIFLFPQFDREQLSYIKYPVKSYELHYSSIAYIARFTPKKGDIAYISRDQKIIIEYPHQI